MLPCTYMTSMIFAYIRKKVISVKRLLYMYPFINYKRKLPVFKGGEVQYFLARKQVSSGSTYFYQDPGLLLLRFSLICCSLNMICFGVFVCYLFCSVFSEFPGPVICYFSLLLKFSASITSNILSPPFSPFLPIF